MTSISNCQFAGLNNKRYYFFDGIVSFPFGHPYLEEIRKYKKKVKYKMQKVIKENQFEMLRIEAKAATRCERLRILRSVLLLPFTYYKLDSNKRLSSSQFNKTGIINTNYYTLNSHRL